MIQDIQPHVYKNHYFPEKVPVSDSPVAFIFLPICIALVYFQAVHPIGKK